MNNAIQQFNQVIQQNAAGAEEIASSAEELSSQAEALRDAVGFFRLDNHAGKKSSGQRQSNYSNQLEPTFQKSSSKAIVKSKKGAVIDLDKQNALDSSYEKF